MTVCVGDRPVYAILEKKAILRMGLFLVVVVVMDRPGWPLGRNDLGYGGDRHESDG